MLNCVHSLANNGVHNGDRVAYKGKNSVEWLSWNLATHYVGGIWVPMYEQQDDNQCQHIVNDCQPKLLISNQTPKINKYKSVILYSNTVLQNSIHLYNKFGFKKIDNPDAPYERSDIKMEYVLPNS